MSWLLALALLTPIFCLVACLSATARARMPALLAFAPIPGLAASLFALGSAPLVLDAYPLRVTLALDLPGAMLLGTASLLWIAAGASAVTWLRGQANADRFVVFWLLTLTGCMGVFLAADMAAFFLSYTFVSLAAYGLVVHDDTRAGWRAGGIYVTLAVLGETLLVAAFVLLAVSTPGERLLISDVVAALPTSPFRNATMALLLGGFALKIGLVPGHVWMPLSYTAAPMPASAALSGAAVKAGVIGLIRFLPLGVAMPGWGSVLIVAGLFSAFYGVAVGITQQNPKTVLAYSSVSQMGVIATLFGIAQASGTDARVLVAFYAAHHVLVKGSLFLAVGAIGARNARWVVVLPVAILALGMGGLPATGGALAKLAVKDTLGYGLVGTLGALSAAGTTLLMLHFLHRLTCSQPHPLARPGPWLVMAVASVAVPWALYPLVSTKGLFEMLAISSIWPVLLGAMLAVALRLWGDRLPHVPAGDVIVVGDAVSRVAVSFGSVVERADLALRQWPAAGLSLLVIVICLGAAMLTRL